ncbi:hypothetical protein BsWGS_17141 [Bradybaena similaris]
MSLISKGARISALNEATLKVLKKGDIVYVSRLFFWHYGIYKDAGQTVIHLTCDRRMGRCTCQEIDPDESNLNCKNCQRRIAYFVRESNFWDFVGKGTAHTVPDNGRRPLDPDVIVRMAESMIGPATYNLKFANCEHFATTCRYAVGFSTKMKTGNIIYMGATWKIVPIQNQPQKKEFNPVDKLAGFTLGDQSKFDVENEAILKSLKMGDIVLVSRPGYWHYGVYTGSENIIHLIGFNWPDPCHCVKLEPSPNSDGCCKICHKKLVYFVRKSTFWDFTSEGKAQIISHHGRRPLGVDEIIRNAKSMLGPAVFDKKNANCEHFATMCRYGTGFSTQTKVSGIVYRGTSWEDSGRAKLANKI